MSAMLVILMDMPCGSSSRHARSAAVLYEALRKLPVMPSTFRPAISGSPGFREPSVPSEARSSRKRGAQTGGVERQFAHAYAGGVGERIRHRARGRSLRRLAGAEEGLPGTVDDVDVHALRHVGEA